MTTPFDSPKRLIDRLLFPSLRVAYLRGHAAGYADGRNSNNPGIIHQLVETMDATRAMVADKADSRGY